jgi:hypothetical protein
MSHATFPAPGASARIPAHGFGTVTRTLLIAAVLSAAGGLLATTMSDRSADITEAPRLAPAPSAVPAPAATGNTSVPEASAVFAGRDVEIEEPAPTF